MEWAQKPRQIKILSEPIQKNSTIGPEVDVDLDDPLSNSPVINTI